MTTNHTTPTPTLTDDHHTPEGITTVTTSTASTPTPTRSRRRVFMWSFLAVQGVYVAWLIVGLATATPAAGCTGQYADVCTQAGQVGTAIGAGIVVFLWVVTDVILGIGRWVVLTSRRRNAR